MDKSVTCAASRFCIPAILFFFFFFFIIIAQQTSTKKKNLTLFWKIQLFGWYVLLTIMCFTEMLKQPASPQESTWSFIFAHHMLLHYVSYHSSAWPIRFPSKSKHWTGQHTGASACLVGSLMNLSFAMSSNYSYKPWQRIPVVWKTIYYPLGCLKQVAENNELFPSGETGSICYVASCLNIDSIQERTEKCQKKKMQRWVMIRCK